MKKRLSKIGGIAILVVIVLIIALYSSQRSRPEEVNITTEKTEYKIGEALKLKVENNLREDICFSSCYPYYFEKRDGDWKSYHYTNCPNSNLVERCINSRQTKAFEIVVPALKTGLHRLALPACLECNLQEKFKEDQWLYSNDFIIE